MFRIRAWHSTEDELESRCGLRRRPSHNAEKNKGERGGGRAGRGRWKRLGGRGKKCRVHRNSHGARTDLNNTPRGCNDGGTIEAFLTLFLTLLLLLQFVNEAKKGLWYPTLVHGINKTAWKTVVPLLTTYLHGEMIDGEQATSFLIYALRTRNGWSVDGKYREISGDK